MELKHIASPDFWAALLSAECTLTLNIAAGLAAGELILALGVVDRLFSPLVPRLERIGIHGKIAAAMVLALGAPRSGAALISRAYSEGELTDDQATFGTLSLAFPGYLKRWIGTVAVASAMAGVSGFIFALVMLLRSACRFVWMAAMLARRARASSGAFVKLEKTHVGVRERALRVLVRLRLSLPWAWTFFALTYVLVPFVDGAFSKYASRGGMPWFLPAEGWAIAAASLAHVTAGLSSAAAALSVDKLSAAQTVLALLAGNMAGSVTRTMRQNVGYWVGVFPKGLVKNLLRWHLVTTTVLEVLSISIVWCITVVS
jgi:hypothetical protein